MESNTEQNDQPLPKQSTDKTPQAEQPLPPSGMKKSGNKKPFIGAIAINLIPWHARAGLLIAYWFGGKLYVHGEERSSTDCE